MDPDAGLSKKNKITAIKQCSFIESLDLNKFDPTEERSMEHEDRSVVKRITKNKKNRNTKNEKKLNITSGTCRTYQTEEHIQKERTEKNL